MFVVRGLSRALNPRTCLGSFQLFPSTEMTESRDARYVVDLFAGCGGLSLGLEEAGFVPLAFSELSPDAAATYAANRTRWSPREFGDISTMTEEVLEELRAEWRKRGIHDLDLVCGGPPCQGYSGIGHRRTHAVERAEVPSNHLYKEMIRVIRALQPKMFLFENVRGLMTGRWTASGIPGDLHGRANGVRGHPR